MMVDILSRLKRLYIIELNLIGKENNTTIEKRLSAVKNEVVELITEIAKSQNLELIIASERINIEFDIARYANSPQLLASCHEALNDIITIERNIELLKEKEKIQNGR